MGRGDRRFMGAMRALEWSVGYADRVERAVVLAVSAAASAEQIAQCSLQIARLGPIQLCWGDYYTTGSQPLIGLSIARGLGRSTIARARVQYPILARSSR